MMTPDALIGTAHFSISLFTRSARYCGVISLGVAIFAPRPASLPLTAGDFIASTAAALSVLRRRRPARSAAGRSRSRCRRSSSFGPLCSIAVGRFGSAGERSLSKIASARTVPLSTCGLAVGDDLAQEVDASGGKVDHRRAGAFVGNVVDVGLEQVVEQHAAEMRGRAGAGRAELHLVLVLLRVGDELREVLDRQVLAHGQDDRNLRQQRDRREVGHRVVERLLIERLPLGVGADGAEDEGVAVRLGIGDAPRSRSGRRRRRHSRSRSAGRGFRPCARRPRGRARRSGRPRRTGSPWSSAGSGKFCAEAAAVSASKAPGRSRKPLDHCSSLEVRRLGPVAGSGQGGEPPHCVGRSPLIAAISTCGLLNNPRLRVAVSFDSEVRK